MSEVEVNPWAPATWNLTQQALYIKQHGIERAKARARDAGTTLGAPRRIDTTSKKPVPVFIFHRGGGSGPANAAVGASWFSGHGAPTAATGGKDGDFYVDLDSQLVYQRQAGSWT